MSQGFRVLVLAQGEPGPLCKNFKIFIAMEADLPNHGTRLLNYPVVEMVINAVADWVKSYRSTAGQKRSITSTRSSST